MPTATFRTPPHCIIVTVLALASASIFYAQHLSTPSRTTTTASQQRRPVSDTVEAALHRPPPPHPRRRGERRPTAGAIKIRRALRTGAVTLSAGIVLVRIDRHCGRGTAVLATLLGMARGAEGTDVALEWSEAPLSPDPWTGRHGHAAVILDDGAVLSLGGYDGNNKNDVFKIVPGGTTLTQVTAEAEWSLRNGLCVVQLPGTNEIVLIGGSVKNDAWRSTDSGLNFTKISSNVFAAVGRAFHGCVAVTATKLFAFGGQSATSVYHNDVRVSTDSGATWNDVDHSSSSCGGNQQRWSKRYLFTFTFMHFFAVVFSSLDLIFVVVHIIN